MLSMESMALFFNYVDFLGRNSKLSLLETKGTRNENKTKLYDGEKRSKIQMRNKSRVTC